MAEVNAPEASPDLNTEQVPDGLSMKDATEFTGQTAETVQAAPTLPEGIVPITFPETLTHADGVSIAGAIKTAANSGAKAVNIEFKNCLGGSVAGGDEIKEAILYAKGKGLMIFAELIGYVKSVALDVIKFCQTTFIGDEGSEEGIAEHHFTELRNADGSENTEKMGIFSRIRETIQRVRITAQRTCGPVIGGILNPAGLKNFYENLFNTQKTPAQALKEGIIHTVRNSKEAYYAGLSNWAETQKGVSGWIDRARRGTTESIANLIRMSGFQSSAKYRASIGLAN
jgi:hypothetical protein